MSLTIALSPAKINLHLRILDKRPDGYHNLQTIFLATNLCDELRFTLSGQTFLTCEGNSQIPTGHENLICRAVELLRKEGKVKASVKIHLKKRIPTEAGLGGGSSNAAVTLLVLNRLWKLNYPRKKLIQLGLFLGADVPFFLSDSATAIGEEKGEKLSKLPDFPEKWLILVFPNISISTRWAYQEYTNSLTKISRKVNLKDLYRSFLQGRIKLSKLIYNDFEEVVFSRYPEIRDIKRKLLASNAEGAVMTGSGSVVVGFFRNRKSAVLWTEKHNDLKTFVVRPLRSCEQTAA